MSEQDLLPAPDLDELLDQALSKDLELLAAKGARGELLSAREREILLRARDSRKSGVEPAFTLEGEGVLAGLAKMTQAELGAIWGYSLLNVKNWVAAGREKNDPPPWAAPALMPAWFERVFSPRRCPAKLAAASQRLHRDG